MTTHQPGASGQKPPRPPREHKVIAAADPVKLGSMLFTLTDPHRGSEVEYNRWYERDHFYSGCMIGPWQFAGKRFVATAELKKMRDPDSSAITGEPYRGSYASLYWVLDGHHDEWNLWAVDQVRALHTNGRMFDARDHVHTLLYRYRFEVGRDADPVPSELALDHPFAGMVAMWVDARAGAPGASGGRDAMAEALSGSDLPSLLAETPASLVVGFEPLPLQVDVPGVARSGDLDARLLLLWFLDASPYDAFSSTTGAARERIESSGLATVTAAIPFVPTIPGTDTYTDELWVDGT